MSSIDEILKLLDTKPLTNIFVEGFLDYDNAYNSRRLHPMMKDVYLEFGFGDKLLRCTSIEWADLEMEIVNGITCNFDIDVDDEFCISSLYDLYCDQPPGNNFVTHLRIFTSQRSNLDAGVVTCMALRFERRNSIFLDPLNTFGIRIATELQLNEWTSREAVSGSLFTRGIVYKEHLWERPFCQSDL